MYSIVPKKQLTQKLSNTLMFTQNHSSYFNPNQLSLKKQIYQKDPKKSTKKNESPKAPLHPPTGEDSRIRFSIEPMPGEEAFSQWKDAIRAVARLPGGVPSHFRKKVHLFNNLFLFI